MRSSGAKKYIAINASESGLVDADRAGGLGQYARLATLLQGRAVVETRFECSRQTTANVVPVGIIRLHQPGLSFGLVPDVPCCRRRRKREFQCG